MFRKSSCSRCQLLDSILAVAGVSTPPPAPKPPAAGNGAAKSVAARAASAAAPATKRKPSESLDGPERKTQRQDLEGKKGVSEKDKRPGSGEEKKARSEAGGSSKAASETENAKAAANEAKAKPTVSPSLPAVCNI